MGNRSTLAGIVLVGALLAATGVASAADDGMDLLQRSMAVYSSLPTYTDSGTAVREGPGLVDRWKFQTYFSRPLNFRFDFQGVTSQSAGLTMDASTQHVVLWMIEGELQSFNQQMRSHNTIGRTGNQPGELSNASAYTAGTSVLVPSLLFSKSDLPGTIRQIREAAHAGLESVNGHRCHKIVGTAAQFYPTGRKTNVRQVTVWLDEQSLLVRKVFEDTPQGYPAGAYLRLTINLDPQANPKLEPANFRFTLPKGYE
ncbi:MAG TPA: hypothetical protein VJS12_20200 [Steroidobacteraceae bacterium]|nr:hypothetical protein [Steroidobacteraceae bacterium]